MTTSATETKVINGVNVDQLFQNIEAISNDGELASFKFRLKNEWKGGGLNRSTVDGYYGTKQEFRRETPFQLDADEPPVLLGTDAAPNPVEILLHSLAACMTTSIAYHAAARGIEIESIESSFEGDIDLRGFLGIDSEVKKGYQALRVNFSIQADATDEQLEEIKQLAAFSPVLNTIQDGVPIDFNIQRG